MRGPYVDSYDRESKVPKIGTYFVWEPFSAPALIVVDEVKWNGEEWWIGTLRLSDWLVPEQLRPRPTWNDLSRFTEAVWEISDRVQPSHWLSVTAPEPQPGLWIEARINPTTMELEPVIREEPHD